MAINKLDLNLLRTFREIYDARSISLAAKQLGLTQPATSNALNRLRDYMDDPLFLRRANSMLPTDKANTLYRSVSTALNEIEQGVNNILSFDPTITSRRIRCAMPNYGDILLLPRLVSELALQAPNITIAKNEVNCNEIAEYLASNALDLAVSQPLARTTGIVSKLIYEDRYVMISGPTHPLSQGSVTIEQCLELKHITLSNNNSPVAVYKQLQHTNQGITPYSSVDNYWNAVNLISQTDTVTILPEQLALHFQSLFGINIHEIISNDIDTNCQILLHWHESHEHDAGHRWIRDKIAKHLQEEVNRQSQTTSIAS